MTRAEVAELFDRLHKELAFLREAGQKEYAHDEDNAFANFERIGDRLGIHRSAVLLTYLLKHIDGITSYVRGHKSQREDVRGRIKDAIVYLHLLYGMVEESAIDTAPLAVPKSEECSHAFVSVVGKFIGAGLYEYESKCERCGKVVDHGTMGIRGPVEV